jgi:hypothetical protein
MTDFRKKPLNIKFHQNPSSGSRVVPCGRTDGQTEITKLIVTFRNFVNVLENCSYIKAAIRNFYLSLTLVSFNAKTVVQNTKLCKQLKSSQ